MFEVYSYNMKKSLQSHVVKYLSKSTKVLFLCLFVLYIFFMIKLKLIFCTNCFHFFFVCVLSLMRVILGLLFILLEFCFVFFGIGIVKHVSKSSGTSYVRFYDYYYKVSYFSI